MIRLSLQEICEHSPYEVIYVEGDLDFYTDTAVHYRISFTQEDSLGGCDTYQIIIRKVEEICSFHDPKVEKSILSIILEYFRLNPNALLYICDTSDHREEARNRLFLNWFKHHDMANRFYIRTAQANVEEEGFYAAVIVERSNLKAADVIADFEETAAMLTHGK